MSYEGFNIVKNFLPINEYTRPGKKITPRGMAIHWTGNINAGASDVANARFFLNRRGSYGSAPYILDADSIQWMMPEDELAYHVGGKTYYTKKFGSYPNNQLIGLEICVPIDQDFKQIYRHAVRFVAAVCKKYGWDPHNHLVRHWDITHKDCPLNMIDLVNDTKHVRWSVESQFASFKSKLTAAQWEAKVQSGIQHVQHGLSIDGVRGDALWKKFLNDVAYEMKPKSAPPTKEKVVELMGKYFADLDDKRWSAEDINKLHERGILNGSIEDGKRLMKPTANLTREEAAVLINNAIDYIVKGGK